MAKRTTRKMPFSGTRHIVSMSSSEEFQNDDDSHAFIEFDDDRCGSFELGNLKGFIGHYRTKKRDELRAIQFTWHGEDAVAAVPATWLSGSLKATSS